MPHRVIAAGFLVLLLLVSALFSSHGPGQLLAGNNNSGPTEVFLISPTGLDFGVVTVGNTSPSQIVTVTNVSNAPVLVTFAGGAASPNPPFSNFQSCNGITLNAGASCQITFFMQPTAAGDFTGISAGTVNGQPFNISLHGIGAPRFLISPTSLEFGEVELGFPRPAQVVTITNLSSAPVVGSPAGGAASPNPPFNATQDCGGITLNPGASCHFFYTFSPTALGDFTGTSSFQMNGQPATITLHGRTPGFVSTATPTATATAPPTVTATRTLTATPAPTDAATATPPAAPTLTLAMTPTATVTPVETPTPTPTGTPPAAATSTPTETATATITNTAAPSATSTSTSVPTLLPPRTTPTRVVLAALSIPGIARRE